MREDEIKRELDELYKLIEQIKGMSEERVIADFYADDKDEFIRDLETEVSALEGELEMIELEDAQEYCSVDPGFRDETDYLSWKFG